MFLPPQRKARSSGHSPHSTNWLLIWQMHFKVEWKSRPLTFTCGDATPATSTPPLCISYLSLLCPPLLTSTDAEEALLQHREFSGDTSEAEVSRFGMHPMIFFGEKFKSCQFSGSSTQRAADPHCKHLQQSGSRWADRRQRFFLITHPLQNGKAWVLPAGIGIDLPVWCFNEPGV